MRKFSPFILFLVLGLAACTSNGGGARHSPVPESRRAALVSSLTQNVLLPSLDALVEAAEAFEEAAEAYATDVTDEEARAVVEARFRELTSALQRVEVMQVGPLGDPAKMAGGEGLRHRLYSWPLENPCNVDMAIVDRAYEDADALGQLLPSHFGFDAAEYLLFHPPESNACASFNRINEGCETCFSDIVAEGQLPSRAGAYLSGVATLLSRDARAVRDAFARDAGDFVAQIEAGTGAYRDTTESMTAFVHAMYYVEVEVKDVKLAIPVGISDQCPHTTCAAEVELRRSGLSKEAILANLGAFRDLYFGANPLETPDAVGFDDILVELGAGEVNDEMIATLDATFQALEAIDGTLEEAIEEDLSSVEAAYASLQLLTTELKTRFIGILDVQPPAAAAGDND